MFYKADSETIYEKLGRGRKKESEKELRGNMDLIQKENDC